MTNIMVVPADRSGCGHYRLVWPGQAVAHARPDWDVSIIHPERIKAGFRDGQFIGVQGFPDPLPDLLVMQRVGTPGQLEVLRWARQQGVATVVDFDDAMWCIDKDNLAWASWNRVNPYNQHWRICDSATQYADVVTVTTEALARRYGRAHGRTAIIPNAVPMMSTTIPKRDNEVVTAGWAGFTKTHPGDCKISAPAAHAVLENGGRLYVVADPEGAAEEWGLDEVDGIGPQKLGPQYFEALGHLDLMLVGLQDTPFNRAKSTLKVLEAAAMGVPSIAPDNAPHRALAREGFPVTLASTPSEWADAAKEYATMGTEARAALSELVRGATMLNHTIEAQAHLWVDAWERALRSRS